MQPFETVAHITGTLAWVSFHVLPPSRLSSQTIEQSYILFQHANTSAQMCQTEVYSPSVRKSIFPNSTHCF